MRGYELKPSESEAAKICAVHSSSAAGVNVFHYFRNKQIAQLTRVPGITTGSENHAASIHFEQEFQISPAYDFDPNIDVLIKNDAKSRIRAFDIECKFSEACRPDGHRGLKKKYIIGIAEQRPGPPAPFRFARQVSPDDSLCKHLHPAQLIKHMPGSRITGTPTI